MFASNTLSAMSKTKDKSMDLYLDELNKLIESKKKENESLKTIVEVISKNSKEQSDILNEKNKTNK